MRPSNIDLRNGHLKPAARRADVLSSPRVLPRKAEVCELFCIQTEKTSLHVGNFRCWYFFGASILAREFNQIPDLSTSYFAAHCRDGRGSKGFANDAKKCHHRVYKMYTCARRTRSSMQNLQQVRSQRPNGSDIKVTFRTSSSVKGEIFVCGLKASNSSKDHLFVCPSQLTQTSPIYLQLNTKTNFRLSFCCSFWRQIFSLFANVSFVLTQNADSSQRATCALQFTSWARKNLWHCFQSILIFQHLLSWKKEAECVQQTVAQLDALITTHLQFHNAKAAMKPLNGGYTADHLKVYPTGWSKPRPVLSLIWISFLLMSRRSFFASLQLFWLIKSIRFSI